MNVTMTVAVADPSDILRSGLVAVLKRTNMNIQVLEITDMERIGFQLEKYKPDIFIVNPVFPGLFSLQQIRRDAGHERMKCIAFQTSLEDRSLLACYDESISLYDTAEQIREKIVRLVQTAGETAVPRSETLSTREKQIVSCVVRGMTNKRIAEHLFLSAHTVITHRRNIAAKLQIHSVAGLTIYAIVNKLVELDDIRDVVPATEE